MTALKAVENISAVRGVPHTRYEPNKFCAIPGCTEEAESRHHIFGRRDPVPDSWYAEVWLPERAEEGAAPSVIVPHVTGLCGSGTTKHHGDVEEHRLWIKYEDGVFVVYEREQPEDNMQFYLDPEWKRLGPLDPQPGKPGRTRKPRKEGEERRKRRRIAVAVPADSEEGGALWDETQEEIEAALIEDGLYNESDHIPAYEAWMAAARDWLNGRNRAT